MKKPIVVIPSVTPKNKNLDKFGGWDWMDISKKAWKYWCDKNDYQLVIYDKCKLSDIVKYRVTIQRWFDIHDFLDEKGIEYSKVLMVDACSVPKWDCPDFFKLTGDNMCVSRDIDNMRWTYESAQGYKKIFNNFELDMSKYINSGWVIFNENHRELFKKFKDFYLENSDEFVKLQTETVKRGTCQTPLNYFVQMNNVKIDFIPPEYRVSHIYRKEMLGHNWQLDGSEHEDTTPFFIKYGYIWFLNGINKDSRTNTMENIWELIKNVHAVDWRDSNIEFVQEKCKEYDNITYRVMDVATEEWKELPKADVVFVDASHDYLQVKVDIDRVIEYFDNPIIIMDDYGNSTNKNIRTAIDDKVREGKLKIHKTIGESVGYKTKSGWEMDDREGIICNVNV